MAKYYYMNEGCCLKASVKNATIKKYDDDFMTMMTTEREDATIKKYDDDFNDNYDDRAKGKERERE